MRPPVGGLAPRMLALDGNQGCLNSKLKRKAECFRLENAGAAAVARRQWALSSYRVMTRGLSQRSSWSSSEVSPNFSALWGTAQAVRMLRTRWRPGRNRPIDAVSAAA